MPSALSKGGIDSTDAMKKVNFISINHYPYPDTPFCMYWGTIYQHDQDSHISGILERQQLWYYG